jgi:hypothetical protein
VRRYTCRCRACGERTTLRSLPAPYERSKVLFITATTQLLAVELAIPGLPY